MFKKESFATGLNYWASHAATEMWSKWDADVVDRDFALFEEYGITVLRVFPLWPDFQPIEYLRRAGDRKTVEVRIHEKRLPDTEAGRAGVDELMMERFEQLCDLAQRHHIELIVCVMTAHMTFRLFTPRAMENLNLYLDPKALKWEGKFFRYFIRRMKHHPAIRAWESGNESNCISVAEDTETAWFWMNYVNTIIREADPERPVIGVGGLAITESSGKWLIRDNAELSDAVSVHPYPMWSKVGSEEFNNIRNLMFACSLNRITEDIAGKPCFIEETGLQRPTATDAEHIGDAVRNQLWNAWSNHCHAFLWWCAFEQKDFDIAPYGWPQPGLEHGIFRADGTPYPAAREMKRFKEFLNSLPFRELPETVPDAICILSSMETGQSTFLTARQAGINLRFQSPEMPLENAAVYMLPSIAARGELSTETWEALKKKVAEGAVLYISLNDTYLTGLEELCGASLISRRESKDEGNYDFGSFKLELPRRIFRKMSSKGAEILARDSEENPVFFRNRYGKGTVYTLSFEVENILYDSSGLFESGAWKIYEMMFSKTRLLNPGLPQVTATDHYFSQKAPVSDAVVVITNCGMTEACFTPELAPGWRIEEIYGDAAYRNNSFSLPPNCGCIVKMEKTENARSK